jgi:hypothetical protein
MTIAPRGVDAMSERQVDILIVGGGVGGCAAAMAATALGLRVIMTEPTTWIGGQLTSQAVPPDEHPWIEGQGCTRRYAAYRHGVRQFYREHYPLTAQARANLLLNPGAGRVSRLCHEPRVGLAVLESMLAWPRACGLLEIWLEHEPVSADVDGDRVRALTLLDRRSGARRTVQARYFLDATELGDLLPLAGVEYVSGAESQADTGEPHAPTGPAQPDNVQAFTWCFAMGHDPEPGADHTIDKPAQYDFWSSFVPALNPAWCGPLLSRQAMHPITLKPYTLPLFPPPHDPLAMSMWTYRRIVFAGHYAPQQRPHEVTLVNWIHNDYFLGNLIDRPAEEAAGHLEAARQLSLSLLYWLQTQAPRDDGGMGHRGLHLCPELMGTRDGLAMAPYIRESRRIRAVFTVLEQHIGTTARGGWDIHACHTRPEHVTDHPEPEKFTDSVGVGSYRIDLHPSTGGDNYIDISSLPFQIPLGALLPVRMTNLLPAGKNIGVTHITNGCYRLHPVEWNIGESAGFLAAFCLRTGRRPHEVRQSPAQLEAFQKLLLEQGVQLSWTGLTPR